MRPAAGHCVIAEIFKRFDHVIIGDGEHRVSPVPAWFRIGGQAAPPKSRGSGVNRKFTTWRFGKILAQIFRELSGRQSLAIYRELLGPAPRGHRRGGI
jgi:hypothetical protein